MQVTKTGWESLLRRVILPAGDRVLRQRMMRRLDLLQKAQWWSPELIEENRDRRVRELISIAYDEVPFYRDLLDTTGIEPADIGTARDLAHLPVVTKDMLRSGYPERVTRRTGRRTYESCSSGSTGRPFCVQEDAYTAGWYRASFLLAASWSGWTLGERHLQMGMTLNRFGGRRVKDVLLRCDYVSAYDLTDEALDLSLELLKRKRIAHVWGYPGAVYFLARRARELGWDRRLKGVVTWGDTLFESYRSTIESTFGCRVYDTYGCAEGMQVAAQCGHGGGYHVHSLDVVIDYLDQGQEGPHPIAVTRLHPGPMPLIRYRVGDLASPKIGACSCGRGFELLDSIKGRESDVITTPSGNRLIVHFFTGILEHYPQIDTFQVVQVDATSISLRVVPATGFDVEVGREVVSRLEEKGADMKISLDVVHDIPLTEAGKRRFVIARHDAS